MINFKFKSLAVCLLLSTSPAFAQTDADTAALDAVLTEMSETMASGNMAAAVEMLPPTMLESMAEAAGMDTEQLLEVTRAQLEAASGSVAFSDVELGGDAIEWKTTEDDKDYALVPGSFVITATDPSSGTDMKMKQTATYIGIPDDDEWYVVDISNPAQQSIFASAYPDYAEVTVPEATTEMMQ